MPNFPSRDLTNQYISRSYQDVVQQYVPGGPVNYLLDGYGNEILAITASDFGNGVVLTTSDTASWAYNVVSASYAQQTTLAAVADVAFLADNAISASFSDTASFALNSNGGTTLVTGSFYPVTVSWAINVVNGSTGSGGTTLATGSLVPITASWAQTSSAVTVLVSNTGSNFYLTFVSSSGNQQLYIDTNSIYYNPSNDTLFVNFITSSLFGTASAALTSSYISASNIDGTISSASFAPQQQNISVNSITTSFFSSSGQVTVPDPVYPTDAVSKQYVDNINPQGLQAYLRADPSDLPNYYQMHDLSFPLSASAITISTASVTTNEYAFVFASDAIGVTNIDFGSFPVHFHAWFTGAGNSSLSVVPEFWLRSASVEIFVADERAIVLNKVVDTSYVGDITLTSSIITRPTDRAILKFRVASQNQNPTMFMNVDGKTSAGIIIPVPATNFVLKAGDTMTGNLTAPGFSGSLFGTSSWAQNSTSASYAPLIPGFSASVAAMTASWANTASFAFSASVATSASYSNSSSFASFAATCSIFISGSVFSNITNSFTFLTQSMFSTQSLYATNSLFAVSSSWTSQSLVAISASFASASISSSWANTSSWAINAINGGTTLTTGSLIPVTASWSQTSSWAVNVVGGVGTTLNTASTYQITASWANNALTASSLVGLTLDNSSSITATTQSNVVILQRITGSFNAAFFDYVAKSGSNSRAGVVFGTWNESNSMSFSEYADVDLGDTSQVTMSMAVSASYVQLLTNINTSLNWTIKSMGRYL